MNRSSLPLVWGRYGQVSLWRARLDRLGVDVRIRVGLAVVGQYPLDPNAALGKEHRGVEQRPGGAGPPRESGADPTKSTVSDPVVCGGVDRRDRALWLYDPVANAWSEFR